MLAVQNMEASRVFEKEQEIEFKALEGSLSMMSKGALVFFVLLVLWSRLIGLLLFGCGGGGCSVE